MEYTSSAPRVALAAGGTGGHVMPALALAEALREEAPGAEILFFCGQRPQEIRWYRDAGEEPVQLPAAPLGRGLSSKARAAWGALRSYRLARRKLRDWGAEAVVGLGGYVSGPCVMAGSGLGLPTAIHEQNAIAGKTNRWLARRVTLAATTYPEAFASAAAARVEQTGNPLRRDFLKQTDKADALSHFKLDSNRQTLLLYGGSQGARALNQAAMEFLSGFASRADLWRQRNWQILWITGAANFEDISSALSGITGAVPVKPVAFVEEMRFAYAAADAVVCRAGSGSLAECAAWGKPIIAVPFPWAADDHQRLNAAAFAQAGACEVLEEEALSPETLFSEIDAIFSDDGKQERMSAAALRLARPDAASHLARLVLEILGPRSEKSKMDSSPEMRTTKK